MTQKQTRDFLIRNIPAELYDRLEKSARNHHRSKTQEAIVILSEGLEARVPPLQKPTPFKWPKKLKSKDILKAIDEGRE